MMLRLPEGFADASHIRLRRMRYPLWMRMPISDEVQSASVHCIDFKLLCRAIWRISVSCSPINRSRSSCQFQTYLMFLESCEELSARFGRGGFKLLIFRYVVKNPRGEDKSLLRISDSEVKTAPISFLPHAGQSSSLVHSSSS